MLRTATSQLQREIEDVRQKAFAAGYAAAMRAILAVVSRSPAKAANRAAAPSRRGTSRAQSARPAAQPSRRFSRPPAIGASATRHRPVAGRPQRGTNALIIAEVLKAASPRAVRQAEISNALLGNGVEISFPSIRNALGQLEARNAAQQVGRSKTWRHRDGAA